MSNTLTLLTALGVNIIAIIAGLYAGVQWLRRWLRRQIEASRSQLKSDDNNFKHEVSTQMANHMTTIGRRFNIIDEKLESLMGIYLRVSEIDEWTGVVDKRITQANDVALIALRRVDDIERKNDA